MKKAEIKPIIMIVDDDVTIVDALHLLLETEGFEVRSALNGEDVFLLMKSVIPDIILLDITMPKMDGFEICKILKENSDTKHIPVIFITGAGMEIGFQLQSLMVGAVDYISKPFESKDLIEKIRTHLVYKKKGT